MAERTCCIPECPKPAASSQGWCKMHETRWRRHGDPMINLVERSSARPVLERIAAKVEVADSGCWIYSGAKTSGYGLIRVDNATKRLMVHRIVYEALIGPIPEGMTLDHLCHTNDPGCNGERGSECPHRACCNPMHVEPVSSVENSMRGNSPFAKNARKTHCPAGHEYTPENTYLQPPRGLRVCRTCKRAGKRRRDAARRAANT